MNATALDFVAQPLTLGGGSKMVELKTDIRGVELAQSINSRGGGRLGRVECIAGNGFEIRFGEAVKFRCQLGSARGACPKRIYLGGKVTVRAD